MVQVVSVVGGGQSFKCFDPLALRGLIIGVNDAALHLPRVDEIVSMDRLWTEHRWPQLEHLGKPTWLRSAALKNVPHPWPDWVRPFDCDHKSPIFSMLTHVLNGANSGYCAFNLAVQMRPQEIDLYGFDMGATTGYWYDHYSWAKKSGKGKYVPWAKHFKEARRQTDALGIRVTVWGKSNITAYPVKKG